MLTVTLVLLGCLVGAMATWGPYANGNYMTGSTNWGTSSSYKPNINYPNYPTSSSYRPNINYPNYPTGSSSYDTWYGNYDSNPSYYDVDLNNIYSTDMYPSYSGQNYNWKPTTTHTTAWKPTNYYNKMSYGYPVNSGNQMSSWHQTGPWKPSVGNTHAVNIGGTSRTNGIRYRLNQGTYKPPVPKQHPIW